MSKELDPAAKREGYVEAPRVAQERAASKTTYFKPAPDPKALRDVSSDPRAKMAGVVISADGHIDPIGVKASGADRGLDPAYEVVRDAIIANAILPDEEGLAYDTDDRELQRMLERAEKKANTRAFDADDPDSAAHNVHADEIIVSNAFYTTGQNTERLWRQSKTPTGFTGDIPIETAGYPAFTSNGVEEGLITSSENYETTGFKRSNFRNHVLKIEVTDGKLAKLSFENEEFVVNTDPSYVDKTALASVAGDEHVSAAFTKLERATNDKGVRTPFVRQMLDPLAILRLLRDVVLDTGAHMMLATRTLNQAVSYQIFNQKAKTGGNAVTNLQRMIMDGNGALVSSTDLSSIPTADPDKDVCSAEACLAGSIALLVRPNLSRTRYSDHHTFLTYEGGVAGYVKRLNANVHNFYAHSGFMEAVRETELYSTVEGAVSPANPIWITNHHDVFSPMDWNLFCTYGSTIDISRINDSVISPNGLVSPVLARYTLDDNIQEYLGVGHPIVTGLHECLTSPVDKFSSGARMLAHAVGKNTFTINVPIEYSTMAPTLWQLLLGLAADHIAVAQKNYLSALVENVTYPMAFTDLEPDAKKLTEAVCFASDSYVLEGWNKPIQPKVMSDVQRLRYCVPEDFYAGGKITVIKGQGDDHRNIHFAPWYLSASDFVMGQKTNSGSVRNKDSTEPDTLHVPKYGIVGLKTDVVARAVANADLEMLNRAYGIIADLQTAEEYILLPYARTEYQVLRVMFSGTDETDDITMHDVWKMPRYGNGFLQMPAQPTSGFRWSEKLVGNVFTTPQTVSNQPASAGTSIVHYASLANQNQYGRTTPAGTLRYRVRIIEDASTSSLTRIRPFADASTVTLIRAGQNCIWPDNRSIVGEKPFSHADKDTCIVSVVGMLAEHPTYAYLGARGTVSAPYEEEIVVDTMCEMYASGLLISRSVKCLTPNKYVRRDDESSAVSE